MPKVWTIWGEEIVHDYCYYVMDVPEGCPTFEELMQRVSYARSDHQGHHEAGELINLTHDAVKMAEDKQKVAELVEQAIMDNSIEIYFQPIYSLEKGRVTSLEVLSRLKDKDKNFINPEFFIHVAEENGDILKLGEQIYRKACIFATQNRIFDMGIEDININLSPVQCCYEELAADLIRIAGEYDIPMSRMHLEITESGIMDKTEIRDTLDTLRSSGAKIALDDFGTGYSNISSIVSLPVDFVKIDKSLVWSYGRGENKYLDQLVPMIHAEGKRIISEGIETQEHIDIFKRLHGDFLQGYFYSKPLPEQEFIQYLITTNNVV
jgi:EAL domain-containing protein (putative c-di-GMP-specific phosphodiesterase class I)